MRLCAEQRRASGDAKAFVSDWRGTTFWFILFIPGLDEKPARTARKSIFWNILAATYTVHPERWGQYHIHRYLFKWPQSSTFEVYLLHCPLIDFDGLVGVSCQQMNLPKHHEGLVVFIGLESDVQILLSLVETRAEQSRAWRRRTLCTVWWCVMEIQHTHFFEVFDEEIAQTQIMADLLRWEHDNYTWVLVHVKWRGLGKDWEMF